MIKPQTLKGFRDFLPATALKRQFVIEKMKEIFERFGFDPLETPALEYAETLMGKYGDEADKLLYLFKDNGGRNVGLRYDQTVPLSRVVAQYQNDLPLPFKRYQIQPVWRAENTQKGRYREFLQCDIDSVGTQSPLADTEIINCVLTTCKALGFAKPVMILNDRTIFDTLALTKKEIIILDKLDKIGTDEVINQLTLLGRTDAAELFETLKSTKPVERLSRIMEALKRQGFKDVVDFRFDPFLARGLDYYTSTIFELKIDSYSGGSLAGGGRYDNLIGSFSGRDLPAVGIAFGFDRLIEAMEELHLLPETKTASQVLVCIVDLAMLGASLELTTRLQTQGIHTEIYLDETHKLEKQLKYADRKGIPYVVIHGPDEASRGVVKLKNMQTKEQEELTIEAIIDKLTQAQ
ncbi:histidine--tRNA ligase [Candidatus Gottesmanbacteria bacterium RBG_13_45_10]|uniref:Histidine--tRNA ligase n=1 Tax=Candidatus Gottesmanbacteria bacterium RBG_13_45_10 TaxID=1798370 RepID=A0A1F5ZH12_9BACT|nr:MAG: histidine--tRNA ligase [Candidatus Gottesmanbacteria bacterium RBG_13_45_10]